MCSLSFDNMNAAEAILVLDHLRKSQNILFAHLGKLCPGSYEHNNLSEEMERKLSRDLVKIDAIDQKTRKTVADEKAKKFKAVPSLWKTFRGAKQAKQMKAKEMKAAMKRPAGKAKK